MPPFAGESETGRCFRTRYRFHPGVGEAIRYAKLIGWDLGSSVDLRVNIPTRLVRNTLTDLCGGRATVCQPPCAGTQTCQITLVPR